MANLILWRHAEAEDISTADVDLHRALTKRGRKDALKMAKWLNAHIPKEVEVLCSPARRCLETADALNKGLKGSRKREIEMVDFLGVDSPVEAIIEQVLNEDSSKTLVLVGHQPNLGELVAKLIGMQEFACVIKKGAVWWLRQRLVDGHLQTYLFTVQNPDY